MLMRATYTVGLVYADGNPFDTATGLTAPEALLEYETLSAQYVRTPPHVLLYDADDPERHVDEDTLREEIEADEIDGNAADRYDDFEPVGEYA